MSTAESYYVVVSPVRNEAAYLPRTILSMVRQSHPPLLWVVVDDGSTDNTGSILERAASEHAWIRAVHREDRGFRQAGGGVVDAFYEGYAQAEGYPWEFLVKLDGDLSFEQDYFRKCLDRFQADPKLGIGGGTVCTIESGILEAESKVDPRFHVRGATKIYRRACWDAIGGLIRAPGWDTLDEVKANMLGWVTRTFSKIQVVHHRPSGGAYGSWNNWVKNGHANYVAGYHPLFMLLKCARRLMERPYGIAGLGLLWGFMRGYAKRLPQIDDRRLIRYFRKQQMNRLIGRRSLWDSAP